MKRGASLLVCRQNIVVTHAILLFNACVAAADVGELHTRGYKAGSTRLPEERLDIHDRIFADE